jgi:hypothetical protein
MKNLKQQAEAKEEVYQLEGNVEDVKPWDFSIVE